jgi:hypothetical protein
MFKVDRNGQLKGLHVVFPNSMTYTGKAIDVEDTITNTDSFLIDGVIVDATAEPSGGTGGGYCLYISPPSGSFVQLANFRNIQCAGMQNGIYLNTSGANTYINGNNFTNLILTGNGSLWTYNTTATGLQIKGNVLANVTFDGLGTAITYTGTNAASNNICTSCYIWDTATPISNGGNGLANVFIGGMDNAYTDAVLSNSYFLSGSGTIRASTIQLVNSLESIRVDGNADYLNNTAAGGTHAFCDKNGNFCTTITLPSGAISPSGAAYSINSSGKGAFNGGIQAGASGSTIADTRELLQSIHYCGTTTTCANTANGSYHETFGKVTLSGGTATVTGITGYTTIIGCSCSDTTVPANSCAVSALTSTSVTFTGNTNDTLYYSCKGQ